MCVASVVLFSLKFMIGATATLRKIKDNNFVHSRTCTRSKLMLKRVLKDKYFALHLIKCEF